MSASEVSAVSQSAASAASAPAASVNTQVIKGKEGNTTINNYISEPAEKDSGKKGDSDLEKTAMFVGLLAHAKDLFGASNTSGM